eukprot:1372923-Karenia_brevis.AAC.1
MQSLLQGDQLQEDEHEITNFFAPKTEDEILDDGVACAEGDVRPVLSGLHTRISHLSMRIAQAC